MKIRLSVMLAGDVQGVGFRYFVKRIANSLNVFGWVRNLPDGRVEIVAEGKKEDVDKFIEFCKKGNVHAKIEEITLNQEEFKGEFDSFQIR